MMDALSSRTERCRASNLMLEMAARMITEVISRRHRGGKIACRTDRRRTVVASTIARFNGDSNNASFAKKRKANVATVTYASGR